MPPIISRGFQRRHPVPPDAGRVPPGQYVTEDYPVLSAGPTPRTALADWTFTIEGLVEAPATWTWAELNELPQESFTADIHCVTKWTHLGMRWRGVSVDRLLEAVVPSSEFVTVFADVPHLYFWKSAKWVRGMRFTERDEPGFWERAGYSNHDDPWREQRYRGD